MAGSALPAGPRVVLTGVHLDIRVGVDYAATGLAVLEAGCARLESLDGKKLYLQTADAFNESCLTMQDVEGNEIRLD